MTEETLLALLDHFAAHFPTDAATDLSRWAVRLYTIANAH